MDRAPLCLWTAGFRYDGGDRVDITRATGALPGLVLAPSWPLLRAHLEARARGRADHAAWERYVLAYARELTASQGTDAQAWDDLIARDHATLVCRCLPGLRCHRHPGAIALAAWARHRGREVVYEGEREHG